MRAPGGVYGFPFDVANAIKLKGWVPQILIRDKINVIVENIRRGICHPPA